MIGGLALAKRSVVSVGRRVEARRGKLKDTIPGATALGTPHLPISS